MTVTCGLTACDWDQLQIQRSYMSIIGWATVTFTFRPAKHKPNSCVFLLPLSGTVSAHVVDINR